MTTGFLQLSREQYDALQNRANYSKLKWFGRSPAHYQNALTTPEDNDRDVLIRGRAAHLALFEPNEFESRVVVYEKRRASKEWDAFQTEHAGKEILTPAMYGSVLGMMKSVKSSPMTAPFLKGGQSEVTVLWTYEEPSFPALQGFRIDCKCRIDYLQPDTIVDVKTVRDASPAGFGRQVFALDALAQAAMYTDAVRAVTGRVVRYAWIAVEASRPYVPGVYFATTEQLELGRQAYKGWLRLLNTCTLSGDWFGYAQAPMELVTPRWAMPEDDDGFEEDAA